MRKSILALAAAGSVFALTAAAASTLTVTGAFNPQAGTGTTIECNPGETTVATVNDGVNITGFTVQTTTNNAASAGCTGAWMWVKVPYVPNVGDAGTYYMRITAKANYTLTTPAAFTFADEVGTIFATKDQVVTPASWLPPQAIDGTTLGSATVLVTNNALAPSAF